MLLSFCKYIWLEKITNQMLTDLMRKILTSLAVSMILFTACKKDPSIAVNEPAQVKADWTSDNSTSNYTSKVYAPYTVFNNVWGANPGYQSIWANNGNTLGIWSNHPQYIGYNFYRNAHFKTCCGFFNRNCAESATSNAIDGLLISVHEIILKSAENLRSRRPLD